MTYVHVYHVVEGSTGEQVFEDVDEQKAKARAFEFAAGVMELPRSNGPITIWRTGYIRNLDTKHDIVSPICTETFDSALLSSAVLTWMEDAGQVMPSLFTGSQASVLQALHGFREILIPDQRYAVDTHITNLICDWLRAKPQA